MTCVPSCHNLERVDFWQVYNMGQIYDMGQVVMCQVSVRQVISGQVAYTVLLRIIKYNRRDQSWRSPIQQCECKMLLASESHVTLVTCLISTVLNFEECY